MHPLRFRSRRAVERAALQRLYLTAVIFFSALEPASRAAP